MTPKIVATALALFSITLLAGCESLARRAVLPQQDVRAADFRVSVERNVGQLSRLLLPIVPR